MNNLNRLPPIPQGWALEEQLQQEQQKLPTIPEGFILESQDQERQEDKSLWQKTKDAVKGNAEFTGDNVTDYEKWQWSQPNFGISWNNIKTTVAGALGSDEDKSNSFFHNNPFHQKQTDKFGNDYFFDKKQGKLVYMDKPGLDAGDVVDTVIEGATYALGGGVTGSIGKTVLGKSMVGGATQGTVNIANQKLAGREDINLGEAGMATVGGALFDAVPAIYNKVRNARLGNLNVSNDAAQAVKFADDNKLPLFFDDVTNSGTVKKIGQQLDEIPLVGGTKTRQIQNQAQKQVAEKFTNKFNLPDKELDDLHGIVSSGARNHLKRSQEIAGKKFEKAYQRLDKAGEFDVPEIKLMATDLIESELKKGSGANQALINEAKNYLEVGKGNFSHWAEIRSDLVAKVRDASKGANETIGTKATGALKRISTVLNKSLDEVAELTGGSQAWRDANNFYNNAVVRYKHGALKTAMKEDNPEKMLSLMIGTGKGTGNDSKHVANQIFSSLDKQGKATVRHGMMQKAYTEALGETGAFNPAKYASMLERFENRIGVFLSKEDKHFVQGLNKYMRFTQNAGDYAANIKTGQKAVGTIYGLAAGASAASNPLATASGVIGVISVKKLFRTKRGRSLMLAMSNIPKGKKPPPALAREIVRYLTVNQNENNE